MPLFPLQPDSSRPVLSDVKALAEWRKGVAFPQWLDVWTSTKWRPAQIQEESEKQFKVAFEYGANEPAEWIDRDSPRLAPYWSRAHGTDMAGISAARSFFNARLSLRGPCVTATACI